LEEGDPLPPALKPLAALRNAVTGSAAVGGRLAAAREEDRRGVGRTAGEGLMAQRVPSFRSVSRFASSGTIMRRATGVRRETFEPPGRGESPEGRG